MNGGRVRAAVVIVAIMIGSGIAGAAIDHAVMMRSPRRPRGGSSLTGGPEAASARRRADMLQRLTRELSLQPAQRAAIDSIMRRTDSALRAVRVEMQPQVRRILDGSRAEIAARLDSTQRARFAARQPATHWRMPQ